MTSNICLPYPNMFSIPPPKVKSAVIKMTRNTTQKLDCDETLFKRVVKTSFNQRRKTLRNSLKSLVGKESEIFGDEIFNKRPEQFIGRSICRADKPNREIHTRIVTCRRKYLSSKKMEEHNGKIHTGIYPELPTNHS